MQFTNKFLLDHRTKSYQLFAIFSEEEYRLTIEINKVFESMSTSTSADNTAIYRVYDILSVFVSDGYFAISNDNGDIIDMISISSFTGT